VTPRKKRKKTTPSPREKEIPHPVSKKKRGEANNINDTKKKRRMSSPHLKGGHIELHHRGKKMFPCP